MHGRFNSEIHNLYMSVGQTSNCVNEILLDHKFLKNTNTLSKNCGPKFAHLDHKIGCEGKIAKHILDCIITCRCNISGSNIYKQY